MAEWLRNWAINQKVVGSIPGCVYDSLAGFVAILYNEIPVLSQHYFGGFQGLQ